MLKHHIFLIHGLTDKCSAEHDFKEFCGRVRRRFESQHRLNPDEHLEFIPVDWSESLQPAKIAVFEKCFGKVRPADKLLFASSGNPTEKLFCSSIEAVGEIGSSIQNVFSRWNLWREWRYYTTQLLADIFAYVDKSDNGIQRTVWTKIRKHLLETSHDVPPFSIVGHSLGAVVAYDMLSSLLTPAPASAELFSFEERIDNKRLQQITRSFRNLYTLGSPVAVSMLRNKHLYNGQENKPCFEQCRNPVAGTNNKWLNFIDTDDVLAYPVEPIFHSESNLNQKPNPADIYVKSSWLPIPPLAHLGYWSCEDVAREIAKNLLPESAEPSASDTVKEFATASV